jgi:hypothetical protein
MPLAWKVDECSAYFDRLHLRGWCFQSSPAVVALSAEWRGLNLSVPLPGCTLPSPDVAATVDPAATHCRFEAWLEVPAEALGRDFILRCTFADGSTAETASVIGNACAKDPYYACWGHFVEHLRHAGAGTVLEIGSRARSGLTYREFLPKHLDYVGLDLLPGPNVDVVGDAHELERLFGRGRFVAAFSLSVFEHLAMPWKVVLELNRVLAPGGLVFTSTHQTWPLHEEPWDFWRFSRYSWQPLFNPATGFEVLEAVQGEPARVHALRAHAATRKLAETPAFLGSAAIARKTGETELAWPVSLETAAHGRYPAGETAAPVR